MEEVTLDTLRALADSTLAEAKASERRIRSVKRQAAALRDNIDQLQSKEDTSERHPAAAHH